MSTGYWLVDTETHAAYNTDRHGRVFLWSGHLVEYQGVPGWPYPARLLENRILIETFESIQDDSRDGLYVDTALLALAWCAGRTVMLFADDANADDESCTKIHAEKLWERPGGQL